MKSRNNDDDMMAVELNNRQLTNQRFKLVVSCFPEENYEFYIYSHSKQSIIPAQLTYSAAWLPL